MTEPDPGSVEDPAGHDREPDERTTDEVRVEATEEAVTGNPQVDAAVRAVRGVQDRPVAEHVVVFEQAHRALRSALNGVSGPQQIAQASRPGPAPHAERAPVPGPPGRHP